MSDQTPQAIEELPQGWDENDPDSFTKLRNHAKTLASENRTLREKAQQLEERVSGVEKRDKFAEVLMASEVEGLTFEDVKDLPVEQITPTALKIKAEEKKAAQTAQLADVAKASGFETVEQYQAAMSKLGAMSAEEKQALVSQQNAATSGTPPVDTTTDPKEIARQAYREAKDKGLNDEAARAAYVAKLAELNQG